MRQALLLLSVLLVGSACAFEQRKSSSIRATASQRIVETEIAWEGGVKAAPEGKQVPVVDSTHIAGYFKLNRTQDAHM